MTGHAVFAPSSAARWLKCPPSATLSQGLPDRPSPAALEGTRVHGVVERTLRTGEIPPLPAPWLPPSKNMPDHEVAMYVKDYVKQLSGGHLLIEEQVFLTKECWGHLDVGHLGEEIITLLDFKNGGWDIEARDNKQMMTYAATFLDEYPNVEWFRLVIFQPNSWMNKVKPDQQDGFKQHMHSRTEIEAHRQQVLAAISYSGPPLPGPQCRWCNAFSRCPAMSNDAGFLMGAISRDPQVLLPVELVRMLRIIRGVSDMKELLENELTSRLKEGATLEGAELKPMRKWTAWNDERQAAETLWKLAGPKGVKAVTPAAAKKLSTEAAQYAEIASHKPEVEMKASY
jgi:hypothetical protein